MKLTIKNILFVMILTFISLVYLDYLFATKIFDINNKYFWLVILFDLGASSIIAFGLSFFRRNIQYIILISLFLLLGLLYLMHDVFYIIFTYLFTFSIISDASKGAEFSNFFIKNIEANQILYFVPIFLFSIFYYFLIKGDSRFKQKLKLLFTNKSKDKISLEGYLILILLVIILNLISNFAVYTPSLNYENGTTTTLDAYIYVENGEIAVSRFGLVTYSYLDFIKNKLDLGPEKPIEYTLDDLGEDNIDDEYIDPISWDNFGESELQSINYMDYYFRYRYIPSENNMTGIFEGKNLILILAESLDEMIINPEVMPNLYEMKQTGYYFENFYAPIYYRTTGDSEFMVQTSIFPSEGVTLNQDEYKNNYFKYTLPNLFEKKGYASSAYHNYNDYFYPRTEFLDAIGFSDYWDVYDLGLAVEYWPSDFEMIRNSSYNYMIEDSFYAYFVSVSGHLGYDMGQTIVQKNYHLFEDLEYDNELLYYFAAQKEFDLALGELLDDLEWYGQLDNTVIAIHSDHYPYGFTNKDLIYEYSNLDRDDYFKLHNVPFLIWTPGLEGTIFDEYMSTIDITPTLSNMFNLEIDYRFVLGKDVFDTRDNYVAFLNNSWISKYGEYNAVSQSFTPNNEISLPSSTYVEDINDDIYYRKQISFLVLDNDYYKYRFLD